MGQREQGKIRQLERDIVSAYTVPAQKTMLIKRVRTGIVRTNGSAGSATITLRVRPPATDAVYEAIRTFEVQTGGSTAFDLLGGITVAAGSDVKFRVEGVSDTNTVAEAALEYLLTEAS